MDEVDLPVLLSTRLTRRRLLKAAAAGAAIGAATRLLPFSLSGASAATLEKQLFLFNWADYINPKTVERFQKEFNVRVRTSFYPSNEDMLAKVKAGGTGFDVTVPTGYMVAIMIQEGLLERLDLGRLPNWKHIDKKFQERPHDPGNRYSVPKDWGTTGYMYRRDVVKEKMSSWADLWRVAPQYKGKISLLDSGPEILGSALKLLGYSWNSANPRELETALAKLIELKTYVKTFTSSEYKAMLKRGEVVISVGWNGDAAALAADKVPIQYVIPAEGTEVWEDDWVILKTARNKNAAYAFVNFLMRPEIAAQECDYTRYASSNASAFSLIDKSITSDRSVYPAPGTYAKLEATLNLPPDALKLRERLWTKLKAA